MPQQINRERVILSTAEAGKAAQLSQDHLRYLVRTGKVEGFKAGHDWLVFEDSLNAYLAQSRKPGPKPKGAQTASNGSMPKEEL